jgi:hypothetical protein
LRRLLLVVTLAFFDTGRRNGMTDTARIFSQTVKKTTETIDDLCRIQSKEFTPVRRTTALSQL